ncbi:MAG: hypothetical protein IKY98_00840 [Alphaproteobacteria bacterium]|nr:hypothetical protein [Alphaproteobacteria bacterium]
MSFLGIPSFEDIGKSVERDYIKPPKEWQDMVASFPSALRERYYSTLGSEGLKSGVTSLLGIMDRKEAVIYFFSDERELARDICSHVLKQKIGLSSKTAENLSSKLIGSESQFGEMISMAMEGKTNEIARSAFMRMVENAEFDSNIMHQKLQEIEQRKIKPYDKNDWRYNFVSTLGHWDETDEQRQKRQEEEWYKKQEEDKKEDKEWTTNAWGRSERDMEQAVKEISQNKPEIIMDMISDEISKKMPSLNAQENKLLSNVLFMAATSENPKDFGEKMSKLMKQGHNLKMMQDIAKKQFGISIGDLSKVTPTQWEHHADWVMKAAGARDFAQLRRHAILKPETIMGSFVGEIEKNPDLMAKAAKHLAPELLVSVDTKFLSGLFGTITGAKTAEDCVKRMEAFLSEPENMSQMNKLLEGTAGNNAEYLKELEPKDWIKMVSSMDAKYGSFDNLKGATILRHNEVLNDLVSEIKSTVIQKKAAKTLEEGAEYLQSGLKKMGGFFRGASR